MYISFEINIQISNFVFKYQNIRILSKYSSICFNPTVIIVVIIVYKHVGLYTVTEGGVGTDTQ